MSDKISGKLWKKELVVLGVVMIALFAFPLLSTPVGAYSNSVSTIPVNHEIVATCKTSTLPCGSVVCGSNNGGKLPAVFYVDVQYNKVNLGGVVEMVGLAAQGQPPNPLILGDILSLTRSGSNFTVKGIIGSQVLGGICGVKTPPMPATYTLTGTCGFNVKVTFKANDGIKGNFVANAACA
jgi:hypothetical protein